MKPIKIPRPTADAALNLAIDTISISKQALIFVNTKPTAEKEAEEIAKKSGKKSPQLAAIAQEILGVFSKPTKQCERLAWCVERGIAFHHAGLAAKQKDLVEEAFRSGLISIICATPTLCLSKGTMIWSGAKEIPVEKLTPLDAVYGLHNNKLVPSMPQLIEKQSNVGPLINITTVSGHSIQVTRNHRLLIKRGSKSILLAAKDVKITDKLATVGNLNINEIENPSINAFIRDNVSPTKMRVWGPEISYLIGAMLGDGYSGAETVAATGIRYKGTPTIVGRDKEIFDQLENTLKLLGISTLVSKTYNGVPQLVLGKNKWFREFLVRCGVEKGHRKHLNTALETMDETNTAALLRGLFDTDGFVERRGGVGFSNISITLVRQIQKQLLRFGIVSRFRERKEGTIKIYNREYCIKPSYEIGIYNRDSIIRFFMQIGFQVQRKQEVLFNVVSAILSNLLYKGCKTCSYQICQDLFFGRTKQQRQWGNQKKRIIQILGEHGELGSRQLQELLGFSPRKPESRLNHHYELIQKRKMGSISKTEWFWSLNPIGEWLNTHILKPGKNFAEFFNNRDCPICGTPLDAVLKSLWRNRDREGDLFWDAIRSIRKTDPIKEVYDVVLPDDGTNSHLFVANGVLVHNSAGLDLPAYRAIIKDLKRYSGSFGMAGIPVLEFLQMAGRAGRPRFDTRGEAICIAKSEEEKNDVYFKYITGEPEAIYSKLAVEPVLRTYLLSLVSTGFVSSTDQIMEFFSKTFWAYQYHDIAELASIIGKTLRMLEEWGFIESTSGKISSGFVSASELDEERYQATALGRRVSELYLDPLTAHHFVTGIEKSRVVTLNEASFLHLVAGTLEMRPALSVRTKEWELLQEKSIVLQPYLLHNEPLLHDPNYEDFLESLKCALLFLEWIDEKDEQFLLETFNVRPGELRAKLDIADWLLFGVSELSRIMGRQDVLKHVNKARTRIKYGVREELLALLRLEGVGRVRARKLFKAGLTDLGKVRDCDITTLGQVVGPSIASSLKKQLGVDTIIIPEGTRKGQLSLERF